MEAYLGFTAARGAASPKNFLIVEPGGHCAGGAITWPNNSYGRTVSGQLTGLLFGIQTLLDGQEPQKVWDAVVCS